MKFPHKSKLPPKTSVCMEKAGTLGPRANNAALCPARPTPTCTHAHSHTERKGKLVFPCGNGLPLRLSARSGATTSSSS